MNGKPIQIVDLGMGGHDPNYYEEEGHVHHQEGIIEGPPPGGYTEEQLAQHHHEYEGATLEDKLHAVIEAL